VVEAAARQPTSSTSGVAAGSNAAAQSLAAAVASGNPPVQAMGNGAVSATVFLPLLLFWWSLLPGDTENKHELWLNIIHFYFLVQPLRDPIWLAFATLPGMELGRRSSDESSWAFCGQRSWRPQERTRRGSTNPPSPCSFQKCFLPAVKGFYEGLTHGLWDLVIWLKFSSSSRPIFIRWR